MRDFLYRVFIEDFLLKAFALIIAVGLAIFVRTELEQSTTLYVRVQYIEPRGRIMVSDQKLDQVRVAVRGPWARISRIEDNAIQPIVIDMSNLSDGELRFAPEMVRLPPGLRVESFTPIGMYMHFEPEVTVSLGVNLTIEGEPPEGYRFRQATPSPRVVRLRGAQNVLESMHHVLSRPVSVVNIRDTVMLPVELAPLPKAARANFLPETVKRFASASIVQFGNELQYDQYRPTDVAPTVEGLKKVCDLYYRPLALKIGRERMAGPSILPHHDGPKWMKLFVDAGFYDPAITRFSDYHLYFGAGTGKQQIVDTVGACDALLPKGIERISSEFGKDVHDANLDYSRLESNYATYATLGISPMAHFMGGTMMRFKHTKGIYSRDGKRINDDVRGCLVKAGAKVQAVQAQPPIA